MPKDRSEHRLYRKSPGRQYGYDYDPLHSRDGHSQSGNSDYEGQDGRGPARGTTTGRNSAPLAQRPDLRRTRQLLRQNIIASKGHTGVEEEGVQAFYDEAQIEYPSQRPLPNNDPREQRRTPTQSRRQMSPYLPPHVPSTRQLMDETDADAQADEAEAAWQEFEDTDPDAGYEDPLDARLSYLEATPRMATRPSQRPPSPSRRSVRPVEPEYEDEDEADYEDEPPVRRKQGKKKVSRRGFLLGAGLLAASGAGIAAYELGPKIPQLASDVSTNIEHQLQDAFNRGVAQGANAVRQEFVTTLENLEGFSLDGAIAAARLTRVAYDTFVSPVIKFGATVATDFLTSMDRAFITARGWLSNIGQDNNTLAAIQSVLGTWVTQVSNMPEQLNAITDADLDGAQAYLHALQLKIAAEKAKLATTKGQQSTPTPTTTGTPTSTGTPTH